MRRVIRHYGESDGVVERLNVILDGLARGKLRVEEYVPDATVIEASQIRLMREGKIAFTHFGSMFPAICAPEYDGSGIPFVFPSIEEVEEFWDSECGRRAKTMIRKRGNAVILGMNRRSPRHLTANIPINDPTMLKGFRLRIPEIDAWQKVWGELGAECVQMPQQNVLCALRTGELDGQENSLKVIKDFGLYKAQKYVMLTRHIQGHIYWVMNVDFYNGMDPDDRDLLYQALSILTSEMNAMLEVSTRCVEENLRRAGCEFVSVDTAAFSRMARGGIEKMLDSMAPEVSEFVSRYID